MVAYTNDLRLSELATGEGSGTWGNTTNTNLELIAEAFSFGTEAITTNADTHTTTIADGASDPGRSLFLKYTGTLDSTCTITVGPNTVSKLWFIENATSGSQSIIIKQGSGATITIANGQTKAIYSDGAGSGAAMVDAFTDLSVPSFFVSGDLDVDGTTNLDVVDIDGAVDFASTTAHAGNATFADNAKAIFGAGSDLQIYHDGSHSRIDEQGTGVLFLQTNGTNIQLNKGTSENMLVANVDGSVDLYYDNSKKLATTSTGIDVTGAVTADGLTSSGTLLFDAVAINKINSNGFLYYDIPTGYTHTFTEAGNTKKLLDLTSGGDISFYEDTGTTPKLFWDASAESLGIGTSSPSTVLDCFQTSTGGTTKIRVYNSDNSNTTTQKAAIFLGPDSRGTGAQINAVKENADFSTSAGRDVALTFEPVRNNSRFEAARLDSDGNLLVGTTSTSWTDTDGLRFFNGGSLISTLSGGPAAYFNRRTNDGNIVVFSKNGSPVGSIGTSSADGFYIHSTFGNDSGLVFGSERIVPCTSSGAFEDGVQDLGYSSGRFKDLYLSGGVVFGTTGGSVTSKTLDDYEEGTWTPTITNSTGSYTTQVGRYTKIGNLVYVNCNVKTAFTNTGTTPQSITGLPFTSENVSSLFSVGTVFPVQGFNQGNSDIAAQHSINSTSVALYTVSPATGINYTNIVSNTFGTTVEFEFSLCYRTT